MSAVTGERGRAPWRTAGLAALGLVMAAVALQASRRSGVDFRVFHAAGGRFRAGADLYQTFAAQAYPYRYAPGVAALFAPLSALPWRAALASWIAVSAALAFGSAVWLDRRLGGRSAVAVPLAWCCFLQPLAQELSHGQVDLAVLALALAAFSAEDADADLLAGALVTVAAALKVAPAILVLDWLVRRRWRAIAGAAGAGVLLVLVLVPRYGVAGTVSQHLAWFATQSADAAVILGSTENQSLWAMARRAGGGPVAGAAAVVALLLLVHAVPDRRHRRLAVLASVPLVSAYGWPQLFVVAVPLLAATIAAGGRRRWLAIGAAASVSLLSYDVAGKRVEVAVQRQRVPGVALLAVVLVGTLPRRSGGGAGAGDRHRGA